MIRRVKLVHNLSAKIYNLPAAQRTIKHFQDHALLKAAEHISLGLMLYRTFLIQNKKRNISFYRK